MINLIKKKGINPQDKSTLYYPRWTRVSTKNEKQLAKTMARGGTYSVGEASGVLLDFPQFIIDELLNGNAVSVDGLGVFKGKVSGRSNPDRDKVTTAGCVLGITFEPDQELLSRLKDEAEFKFVEKPSEEGEQDAEDNGDQPDNGDNGGTTPTPPAGGGENEE